MPPEADPALLQVGLFLLKWLGLTSLVGAIGFLVTFHYLLPRLTIVEVKDRHPKHSFESRFIVKNIGKLPAYDVWANVYDLNAVFGQGNRMSGISMVNNGSPVSRLDGNETMEVPVMPQIGMSPGYPISACEYELELTHSSKLLFLKRQFKRCWKIELRNFGGEFTWHFSPL